MRAGNIQAGPEEYRMIWNIRVCVSVFLGTDQGFGKRDVMSFIWVWLGLPGY